MLSIANKPKIAKDIIWRRDGQEDQIIVLSREDFPLPLILNPTAAMIFSLCSGENSLEDIARSLCEEFERDDFSMVLEDVKCQVKDFCDKGIVEI